MLARTLVCAVAGLSIPVPGLAAETLQLKTGLWEITSTMETRGALMSKEELAKLKPEQRARIEAAVKEMNAQPPETDTEQECLTEEDLRNPFDRSETENCQQTIVSMSSTTQELTMVCTGKRKGSGRLTIKSPTPNTMTATMDLKFGEGADVLTVKGSMKGKWLGADCGDLAEESYEEEGEEESAEEE